MTSKSGVRVSGGKINALLVYFDLIIIVVRLNALRMAIIITIKLKTNYSILAHTCTDLYIMRQLPNRISNLRVWAATRDLLNDDNVIQWKHFPR